MKTAAFLSLLAIATATFAPDAHAQGQTRYQSRQFCQSYNVSDGPVVALLIDRTLPRTNDFDRSAISSAFEKATALLKPGYRLHVVTIRGDATERRVVFDDCKPGKLVEGIIGNLTASPDNTLQVDHDTPIFRAGATSAVDAIARLPMEQSRASAVMATIAAVGREFSGRLRGMIIASDLIEGQLANLLPTPDHVIDLHARGQVLTQANQANLIPSLGDIHVEVFGIGLFDLRNRPALALTAKEALVGLWAGYFKYAGVKSPKLNR